MIDFYLAKSPTVSWLPLPFATYCYTHAFMRQPQICHMHVPSYMHILTITYMIAQDNMQI